MDILIIKEEFGEQILTGKKTWELRGTNTKKRGTISIAYSKTQKKFGTAELVDAISLTKDLFDKNIKKHCSTGSWTELKKRYKTPYAWVFKNAKLFKTPKPYKHPYGAVIWVKE